MITNKIPTDDELFENGHPCEYCITKAPCGRVKGLPDNNDCDLPEQYEFWKTIKYIEHLEIRSKNGDFDSIEELADFAKKMFEKNESMKLDRNQRKIISEIIQQGMELKSKKK